MQIVKQIDRVANGGYERTEITELAVVRLDAALRVVARAVFLTVEDISIRYRIDGGNPDQDEGHLVIAGNNIWLNNKYAVDELRMIAIGTDVTAVIIVTYYY